MPSCAGDNAGADVRRTVEAWLPRSGRIALLLFLTTAYLLPLIWTLYRVGDDGTLLYGAQRVSEGAVPGRDFLEVMGPGSFYWLGMFFKLFGPGWHVTRLVLLFTGVATVALVYDIAGQVCSESVAVLVWLFVLVVGMPVWAAVSHHWDSNLFAITALWCYLKLEKTGHWPWGIAAGTLAAITSCFMQQKGMLLLLAFVTTSGLQRFRPVSVLAVPGSTLASRHRQANWKAIWLVSSSYATFGICVLAAFWRAGALGGLYYSNFIWPVSGYHAVNTTGYGQLLVSIAMGPAMRVIGPNWAAISLFCAGLSLIPFLVVAIIPLLLAAATLACLLVADRRSRFLAGPLLPLTLVGGALWLSEMHRLDGFHSVYGSPVALAACFASAQMTLSTRLRRLVVGLVATGLIVFGASNFVAHKHGSHAAETRRGTIQSVSDDDALHFLCTDVRRGEFVFIYPYYPVYYYLADVTNPTRFSILLYNYNTPQQFDEVIQNLEEKRVRYVLWDTVVYGDNLRAWFPGYRHPTEDKLKLEYYLQTRYDLVATKSGFRVLRRRGSS